MICCCLLDAINLMHMQIPYIIMILVNSLQPCHSVTRVNKSECRLLVLVVQQRNVKGMGILLTMN